MSRSKLQSKEVVRGDVTSSWTVGWGSRKAEMRMVCSWSCFKRSLWCGISWQVWRHRFEDRFTLSSSWYSTSKTRLLSSKCSPGARTACGKYQTRQVCCASTGLLEISTAASAVNPALLCSESPGSWINCVCSLRLSLYFVIFYFSSLLKHKVLQSRECLSSHLYGILQNGNLPVLLGPLGSANCNLCEQEGEGLTGGVWSPQTQFQLRESHKEPLGLCAAKGEWHSNRAVCPSACAFC